MMPFWQILFVPAKIEWEKKTQVSQIYIENKFQNILSQSLK